MKLSDKGAALLEEFEGFRSWLGCSAPREALRQLAREDPLMPTLVGTALHETCGAWRGAGPCGRPAVERLHYANEWMDHPGQPGLTLCAGHLNEYVAGHLLVPPPKN